MSEGDDSNPPSTPDRAAALARKLTGARGALGKNPTNAPRIEHDESPPISPPVPSERSASSKREAVLAARRASITPATSDLGRPAERPEPQKSSKKRTRKAFLVLGGVLVAGALVVTALFAKSELYARSDDGRVHAQLLAWEFGPRDPAARDAAFAELDRMGPKAMSIVIDKLSDASIAEHGSSRSTHTVQQLAHLYLVHFAKTIKAQPPKESAEIEKVLFEGASPNAAQWQAARDAWRAWYADQQARGAAPK